MEARMIPVPPLHSSRKGKQRASGFSLVEVVAAFVLLIVGGGGVVSMLVATRKLETTNREVLLATTAAEAMLERLKATEFDRVYALFNDRPGDDPGPGPAPGANFDVPFLTPRADDTDGMPGRILFPKRAGAIREDFDDVRLGMPRDLDMNGVIDAFDHSADCKVLPVCVQVLWSGVTGQGRVELFLTLTEMSAEDSP
jgi:type II secretory pathway pseudopilin PulG